MHSTLKGVVSHGRLRAWRAVLVVVGIVGVWSASGTLPLLLAGDPPARVPVDLPIYWPPSGVAADLDGDGRDDIVVPVIRQGELVLTQLHLALGFRPGEPFRRGDVNASGTVELADALQLLSRLFAGGDPLGCPDAADTDDDGRLGIGDAVSILLYLFRGGAPPLPPGPEVCGEDPSPDRLRHCVPGCG